MTFSCEMLYLKHDMQNGTIRTNRTSRRQFGVTPLCISASAGFLLFGIVEMGTKKCSKCKEVKALSDFNTRPDRKSGFRSWCKKCQYKSQRLWRLQQREKVLAKNRANYATRTGVLIKPASCQACKQEKPLDRHHPDYKKPLGIVWLCRKCHMAIHAKAGAYAKTG